jgi:hypothetical protein
VLDKVRGILPGDGRPPKGLIRDWQQLYGRPRPNVAALIGLPAGGSHFLLHKMHGHPQVLALSQGALYPKLKDYMRAGMVPIAELYEAQLLPTKRDLGAVRWLVVNKPQIAFISHQFLFHRDDLRLIYCLRNPVALFHSRFASMSADGLELFGQPPSWEAVADSVEREVRVSLAGFAQAYDPTLDCAINLESSAAHVDENLALIWNILAVPPLRANELQELEICEDCGTALEVKEGEVEGRHEELLHCPNCGLFYTGPGGYNYIRRVDPERLAAWKEQSHAEALVQRFAPILGAELMAYFDGEAYLEPDSPQRFKSLFDALMARIRI